MLSWSLTSTSPRCLQRTASGLAEGRGVFRAKSGARLLSLEKRKATAPAASARRRPVLPTESARCPRSCGKGTLHPGRRCRFPSRRPKHSSDRFRQVGGSKWRHSQQPRKLLQPGGRQESRAGNFAKRGLPEGTRGPGSARTRLPAPAAGTRLRPSGRVPREPAQLSPPRAPAEEVGRTGEGAGPGGRTHLRRSVPGRQAAAAAAAAGAG